MTSLAFILGTLPLLIAHGAGAEMRRTLGTAVFSGMLGVTVFGIFLTPVFFNVIDWLGSTRQGHSRGLMRTFVFVAGVVALLLAFLLWQWNRPLTLVMIGLGLVWALLRLSWFLARLGWREGPGRRGPQRTR
jgi:multidrug efflux pump